ncbi:MAG: hypothetical protein U1E43_02380 [Rhodospirillales bacterium]
MPAIARKRSGCWAWRWPDARRLRIPEAAQIEAFLQQHGLRCP